MKYGLADEFQPETNGQARIIVFGVGGGGGNAVEHMVRQNISGITFVCANTDLQALNKLSAPNKIQIGADATRGLGAGANPEVGRNAAESNEDEIRAMLEGYNMAFITAVFEAQEKFEHFEQFRNWTKVGAGFCDWLPGGRGGVIPVPRSIAFHKLEDFEMRAVHDDIVAFLRSPHAGKCLWKHLSLVDRMEMIETILRGWGE